MIAESHKKKEFVKNLLAWHAENKRTFSWRRTKNPFHILIAEIMLQKTDAKKVSEIYDRFLAKYPNAKALSEASVDELRREILLLGIYSRAERLRKLAIEVIKIHGGDIPSD